MTEEWRVVHYPMGDFYMIWKGLVTDHVEYQSRSVAEREVKARNLADKMNAQATKEN